MEPNVMLMTVRIARSLAEYMGLIDVVTDDVKKLLHQSDNSAVQMLEYADNSSDISVKMDYLKQAQVKFVEAIAVEECENLVLSYVGLAMCQHLLGDDENARMTLIKIKNVELSRRQINKAICKGVLYELSPFTRLVRSSIIDEYPVMGFSYMREKEKRQYEFDEYKRLALSTSEGLLSL